MNNLINETKERIRTLEESLEEAYIKDITYLPTYKLALKELKVLKRYLKKLTDLETKRSRYFKVYDGFRN